MPARMKFLAILVAAGALVVCAGSLQATEPPLDPETATSDTPALPERCKEWLEWIVDGNGIPPHPLAQLRLPFIAVDQTARACLGRPGEPGTKRPVPDLVPITPTPPPPPKPDDAERITL